MFSKSPAGPGAEGLVQLTVGLSVARSLSEKVLFQETLSQHTMNPTNTKGVLSGKSSLDLAPRT